MEARALTPAKEPTYDVGELAREATQRMAAAGIAAADGRVTSEVDVRTVRFYASLGLVARPLAYVDRRARYGRRHLLQVLAVKRLQAAGSSLSDAQISLAGATDAQLAELADGSASLEQVALPSPEPRFWQQRARRATAPDLRAASTSRITREARMELEPGIALVVDLDRWPEADDPCVATRLVAAALRANPQLEE